MAIIAIFAAVFAFSIGIAVLWANPGRFTNQAFAVMALVIATRTFCIYNAVRAGVIFDQGHGASPVPMLRAAAAASMFVPWLLWIIKESLVIRETEKLHTVGRSMPWLGLGAVLAAFCLTNSYYRLSDGPVPYNQQHGFSYVPVNLVLVAVYIFLIGQSWFQSRRQTGIRRIEMQFLVLNYAIGALLAAGLAILSHLLGISAFRQLSHLIIIVACGLAAWAVTYYRIFDVRQVFISLAQRVGLVAFLGLGIIVTWLGLCIYFPQPVALVVAVAIFSSGAFALDRRSREWLGLGGERSLSEMRRVVIELARTEPHPEKLGGQFEAFLCEHCSSSRAGLLFDRGESYEAGEMKFVKSRPGYVPLYENGWATPESLLRRRSTPSLADLAQFLTQHSLGLVVAAPRGSPNPTLLIALGTKTNEWPFTYPEVQRLQNIAELMDNILTRSRLTLQAAMKAKMEHLAMMSRGLAHDLNNLITPISSFLVHTDDRFPADSPEHEVHAAARRSVRIMGDYVREALFFAERLTPRFEAIDLVRIFQEVYALTTARAAGRGVTVSVGASYSGLVTGDGVLLQRMLTNLVGNAIDASNPGGSVILSAFAGRSGFFCLRVADQGCGIAPENLGRIFDPYFTTKKYGDDVRGFGLGLTICQKIVDLHGGTVSVDSQVGHGTIVTIDLPVTQNV